MLEPLTGVGTDMSVTRPLDRSLSAASSPASEREAARGGERRRRACGLRDAGRAGGEVLRRRTSWPPRSSASRRRRWRRSRALDGVSDAAGSLTLNAMSVSGTVPEHATGGPVKGRRAAARAGRRATSTSRRFSVTGIDQTKPALAPVTAAQITKGRYLSSDPGVARGDPERLPTPDATGSTVGETIELGGKSFKVVGLALRAARRPGLRHLPEALTAAGDRRPEGPGQHALRARRQRRSRWPR